MIVTASAPGKLLLLGEYAVLDGAPALVMAVNRRARVTLETAEHYSVHAPHMDTPPEPFTLDAQGQPQWASAETAQRFRLVDHLLRQAGCTPPPTPFRATLDTSAFFHRHGHQFNKLGLGSSAALTVALHSALQAWAGEPAQRSDDFAFSQLLEIHRGLQDGHGSGFDVAAALHGSTLGFQLLDSHSARITPLGLPAELQPLCIWSGKSASTGNLVGRVRQWQAQQPVAAKQHFKRMRDTAKAGLEAVRRARGEELMALTDVYCGLLVELGEKSGANIVSAEHRKIRRIAGEYGAVYKPCGAGGGDVGILLTTHGGSIPKLRNALQCKGFPVIPLDEDPDGLHVTTRSQHGAFTHT